MHTQVTPELLEAITFWQWVDDQLDQAEQAARDKIRGR